MNPINNDYWVGRRLPKAQAIEELHKELTATPPGTLGATGEGLDSCRDCESSC